MSAISRAQAACATALLWSASTSASTLTRPQSDYILACGGCHGPTGVSNSNVVPRLEGLVGYYLNLPAGRDYLPRLPNIAFAAVSDQRLTDLLNYMVFVLGRDSVPAGAKPYVTAEVARLRKRPLTEVSLIAYRRGLVDVLIQRYGAPAALGAYGDDGAEAVGAARRVSR
jgi:hypothetical protein